jgi:hypothetical protein
MFKSRIIRLALLACLATAGLLSGNAQAKAGEVVRVSPIVRVAPIVRVGPVVPDPVVPVGPIVRGGPVYPQPWRYEFRTWHGFRWVR